MYLLTIDVQLSATLKKNLDGRQILTCLGQVFTSDYLIIDRERCRIIILSNISDHLMNALHHTGWNLGTPERLDQVFAVRLEVRTAHVTLLDVSHDDGDDAGHAARDDRGCHQNVGD